MNPNTNRFEALAEASNPDERWHEASGPNRAERRKEAAINRALGKLVRPSGEPVPDHWTQFKVGEHVVIKDYTFKVAYIGETSILFEPVGPVLVGQAAP